MNLRISALLILCSLAFMASAQQMIQRTQFDKNLIAYNPGVVGVYNYIPVVLNMRQQWLGIEDAPASQTLSAHGFIGRDMGAGFMMYNDIAGPVRNTGINISAARHFRISQIGRDEYSWISAGMGGNMYQYLIDETRLTTTTPGDPAIAKLIAENSNLTFDLSFGLFYTRRDLYAGLSAVNLLQNKTDLYSGNQNANNLKRVYYAVVGYKYPVSLWVTIEPTLLVKLTQAGAFQPDLMVKGYYKFLYMGVVFRPGDALAGMFGLELDKFLGIHYSYDYNVNDLNVYSNGTHELSLTIKLFEPISRNGEVKREKPKKNPRTGR